MKSAGTGLPGGAPHLRAELDPAHLPHPTHAFLRAYWEGKRRGRLMPARADIDPVEMKAHLGWIVLADVLPGCTDFRLRLVGTLVTEYFLRDNTGRTIKESFAEADPAVTDSVLAAFRTVARERAPLRSFGSPGWLGREFLDFDLLLLPLSAEGVHVDIVMGAFTFDVRKQSLVRHARRA